MNRRQVLVLSLMVAVLLLTCTTGCANKEAERKRDKCQADCEVLSYEYRELLKIGAFFSCRCWNEGMETRYNPWGQQ